MGLMKEKMEKKTGEIPTPLWDVITVLGSDPPGAAARPPLLELRERARIKKKNPSAIRKAILFPITLLLSWVI